MNLSDREIQNILSLKLNFPMNPINFRALGFQGTTDGTTLTRLYNANDLKNNFVRIISLHFAYYSNATWMRENAQDNKIFTANTNSRYSMVRTDMRLAYEFLEAYATTNSLNILVDNDSLNLFSGLYYPASDEIILNVMPQSQITNGIDIQHNIKFSKDMESDTLDNVNVVVTMYVEIINDINPLKLEQIIE